MLYLLQKNNPAIQPGYLFYIERTLLFNNIYFLINFLLVEPLSPNILTI